MARVLEDAAFEDDAELGQRTGRLDRAAARAFAMAISSLLIATLVVSQSAQALKPEGTVAGNNFEVGTITLVDDDEGRSLVELTDMAPGRPVEECINVSYEGSILPVDVSLGATTVGDLARYIVVEIDRGDGGGYGSCEAFTRAGTAFSGTLAELAEHDPTPVGSIRNQGDGISFRFRFELLDDERALAEAASVDFIWEALPS